MRSNQQGKRRLIVIVILIVAVALLVGIVIFKHTREKHRYLPILNLHPKNFITISGKIDQNISGKIIATYQNSNETCFVTKNWLEVGPEPRVTQLIYSIKPKGDRYSLKLPIDKLIKGKCGWKFEGFDLLAKYHNLTDDNFLFYFKNNAISDSKNFDATSTCRIKTYDKKKYLECQIQRNYDIWLPQNTKNMRLNIIFHEGSEQ